MSQIFISFEVFYELQFNLRSQGGGNAQISLIEEEEAQE